MLHILWAAPLYFPVRWSWSLTLVSSSGFSQSQHSSASWNDSSSCGVICNSKFVLKYLFAYSSNINISFTNHSLQSVPKYELYLFPNGEIT